MARHAPGGSSETGAPEPKWRRYLRFWRADPHADVDEEVRFHLESRIAENIASGMTREAAEREARERFGDVDGIAKTLHFITRDREMTMRRTAWLDTIRQDLSYALRQLVKNPGFTAVAVLTLALGIGANSAIFSVLYSVMLRPLPYANADRILSLREQMGPADQGGMVVTFGNFGSWRERARGFEAIGAYYGGSRTLTGAGDPQRLSALVVTEGYFRALYIPPVLGRYFNATEDQPGGPNVVVLSYAFWKTTFNGDAGVVGRHIVLSGVPHTVIGVASPAYALRTTMPPIYLPLVLGPQDLASHADHELAVYGLVRAGMTPQSAVADLTRLQGELKNEFPRAGIYGGILAVSLREDVIGPYRQTLFMLGGAVALVLLIACTNITNLLLARAAVRHKEIAVRAALGAGRARIVAQLLAESVVLAITGAGAGLGVAALSLRFLIAKSPLGVPRLQEAHLNLPVLLFTAGLALVCGIAFGVFPALRATRLDLQQALRAGGRESSGGVRERMRSALVVTEMALALVLLIGAGLLVKSAILLQRVPPGFNPENVLAANTALPGSRYTSPEAITATFSQIQSAVAALPGVKSAALVSRLPIGGFGYDCGARAEGSVDGDGKQFGANKRSATPDYFATIGLPLVRGRTFTTGDVASSPPVVVINAGLARRLFGDADPIGKRVSHCDGRANAVWREVVGVTGDMHARGLDQEPTDEVYYPYTQFVESGMTIVIKGSVPVASLGPAVRQAVSSIDPLLALSGVATMDTIIARSLAYSRFRTFLFLMLGLTGLVLSSIGIYGVIAYFVTQRAYEIGIRMALGADARRVLTMVVRQGIGLAAIGVAIGTGVSLLTTRWVETFLFGVSARDPVTFVAVSAVLILVAALASFIPARRATRVDPLSALRSS